MQNRVLLSLFLLLSIVGCYSCSNVKSIKEDKNPIETTRYLRIKIFVEEYVMKVRIPEWLSTENGSSIVKKDPVLLTIPARNLNDIEDDIAYAEDHLKNLKIKFCLTDLQYITPLNCPINSIKDMEQYSNLFPYDENCIYLFYIFTHGGSVTYAGIGNFPWSKNPTISLTNRCDKLSFTHELGHFLGLYHTFESDDYVEDTPPFENANSPLLPGIPSPLGQKGLDPCYDNIMTYYQDLKIAHFTDGQFKRMNYFLINKKKNIILEQYEGYPFKIEISARYLETRDKYTRDILNNNKIPVMTSEEAFDYLTKSGLDFLAMVFQKPATETNDSSLIPSP